jgi:hypothetical protein
VIVETDMQRVQLSIKIAVPVFELWPKGIVGQEKPDDRLSF